MADSIRAAAERLLKYLEANRGHDGMFPLSESQEEFNLRTALAAELPAPAEPATDAVLSSAPVPAAEGEREELAALINQAALGWEPEACLLGNMTASQLARAAVLLQQADPAPVPVTERPWERPGWCDAEGRCGWLVPNQSWPCLYLMKADSALAASVATHCLPHWAIPQPPQGGEAP